MEGVFEVSFGPTFDTFRQYRYRAYRKLPRRIELRLEEIETNRLYRRLIAAEPDFNKRECIESEHMWEQQKLDEERALFISNRVWKKAHRMYIETPPLTGKKDDPSWINTRYVSYGSLVHGPRSGGRFASEDSSRKKSRVGTVVDVGRSARWMDRRLAEIGRASGYDVHIRDVVHFFSAALFERWHLPRASTHGAQYFQTLENIWPVSPVDAWLSRATFRRRRNLCGDFGFRRI